MEARQVTVDEPSIAAKITEWLWALPVGVAAMLWRMLNGKASKEQLLALTTTLDRHVIEDRQTHESIVERLDITNVKLAELVGEIRGRRDEIVKALAQRNGE